MTIGGEGGCCGPVTYVSYSDPQQIGMCFSLHHTGWLFFNLLWDHQLGILSVWRMPLRTFISTGCPSRCWIHSVVFFFFLRRWPGEFLCSAPPQPVNHLRYGGWLAAYGDEGRACPYKALTVVSTRVIAPKVLQVQHLQQSAWRWLLTVPALQSHANSFVSLGSNFEFFGAEKIGPWTRPGPTCCHLRNGDAQVGLTCLNWRAPFATAKLNEGEFLGLET